jgi:protein O-GlcNAc transferase
VCSKQAIEYYRAALKLQPDNPNVLCNLSHSLQMICEWHGYEERMRRLVELATEQVDKGIFPSIHPHHSFLYPLPMRVQCGIAAAHAAAAVHAAAMFNRSPFVHDHKQPQNGRLRIGYVSSDFKVRKKKNWRGGERRERETEIFKKKLFFFGSFLFL